MTVVISGTNGIQNVLGSAAAPAESNTTSSNTGLYFPTSTTLGLSTAGTNAVYIDASQNVGLNNNVNLQYKNSSGTYLSMLSLDTSNNFVYGGSGAFTGIHQWYSSGAERARIDSSGNVLVAATAQYGGEKFNVTQSAASTGILVRLSSGPYNSSSNAMVIGYDGTAARFYFPSNGGLYNYSANNSNLSDARTKTEIKDAGSYLAKICAIPVRTFKYIDQTDDLLNLGCIAQEMEAVAPELVNIDGFGDEVPEDGIPLKGIYQTDLQYALMKCIQEQQALITSLTARIEALEAR